ncbi:ATP phosphoribosyltransferase regulatory subunit [Acaryochloris sp. IP29b_bin.148]|uniref:ATP phosphoribosyltransferase regulatory subunit n=1 Tax=Acaryochloris sp. IP29b_bin.148 TaxID=2969218 RepID=UPI002620FF8E|nr:ATP phosphoribosyltransferase regulatory subunit [Acaryochloris sp. IP29b_bin.148]
MYQPPAGARDLLPLDVAQKSWIEQRLQQVFQGWGYHRIITPTLERLDTLIAGGAVEPQTVIQVWDPEEGVLGLRPELTASIARAAVTRMEGAAHPQRLYYNANIFRQQPGHASGQHEFYQAGVELLGSSGLLADAEILLLLADCLRVLGVQHWHVILGEADLTRSLLQPFPDSIRNAVRRAIAQLDRVGLANLPLSSELRDHALFLLDLRGEPAQVLQKVGQLPLEPPQQEAVNNLKSLVEVLSALPSLTLDLSLIQTFDYYTGIVFEIISDAESGQRVLGQGGRYDKLLGLYHPQGKLIPGIGFSFNVEPVHQVLLTLGKLPQQTPASHWLVVAETEAAIAATFAHAQHLRQQNAQLPLTRVEVELSQKSPDDIRATARQQRISQIAWVNAQGSVTIESLA